MSAKGKEGGAGIPRDEHKLWFNVGTIDGDGRPVYRQCEATLLKLRLVWYSLEGSNLPLLVSCCT